MPFRFKWMDNTHRVMTYIVEGDWNWKDYHHAARASIFSMTGVDHLIDSLIDLRGSTRATLPSGLPAHVRSFGKKTHVQLSGRALVIGMPDDGITTLQVGDDMTLPTTDGFIRFVATDDELAQVLDEWLT